MQLTAGDVIYIVSTAGLVTKWRPHNSMAISPMMLVLTFVLTLMTLIVTLASMIELRDYLSQCNIAEILLAWSHTSPMLERGEGQTWSQGHCDQQVTTIMSGLLRFTTNTRLARIQD